MFGFLKKKQQSKNERNACSRKDHDFWMNELQYLWLKNRRECLTIRGRDIECCWCDNREYHKDDSSYQDKCYFMIRTRSGGEFSLAYESWLKARFEDPNYKCVK